jgi:hypothetical protein
MKPIHLLRPSNRYARETANLTMSHRPTAKWLLRQ